MNIKPLLIFLLFALSAFQANAQRHEIFSPSIATLQVVAGQNWMQMPVVGINASNLPHEIVISFDDLSHTYHRYTYKIEHCEFDWSTSTELFESDYIDGFADGNTIDDYEESLNTNTLYTHYQLTIPNDRCRLKLSGNYRLTIIDENDDNKPVLSACFMASEQSASTSMAVTTNTDAGFNSSFQQVEMNVAFNGLNVTNPSQQIKTVVLQNARWSTARQNAKPQFATSDAMRFTHCRQLLFPAGNEHHKYEILATTHPTMGIDHISWDGTNYHVYPFTAEPRPNYVYDEDANGAFYIRNSDNRANSTMSEYVIVHYELRCPKPVSTPVYVNGWWTLDSFSPKYQMHYDELSHSYKAAIRQKQGYYSYQFVTLEENGNPLLMPTEGNFYQTENTYQSLVYYRSPTDRTDRLVSFSSVKTR